LLNISLRKMIFTGKDDGPSIEEYIQYQKSHGKITGEYVYTMVSKKMLAYGGTHLIIMS
jgi:hypothetical protein